MKVLVTGGLGFIGTNLLKSLLELGADIVVLDPFSQPSSFLESHVKYKNVSIEETAKIIDILSLGNFECLVHLVSAVPPAQSSKFISKEISDYVLSSINFFELAIKYGIKRIIFSSSAGALYTSSKILATEEDKVNPKTFYGLNKLYIEQSLQILSHLYAIEYCNFRISNVYGPGQIFKNNQGVIANFCCNVKARHPIEVWGDGNNVKDYIYISDLTDLISKAVFSNKSGTYNAGSGFSASLNDLVKLIGLACFEDPVVNYISSKKDDNLNFSIDSSLAMQTFDWLPKTQISDGIFKYIKWLNENAR
jgi:UDP-glucose 4-epimerase